MVDTPSTLLSVNPQLILANGVHHDTVTQIRESSLSHYVRTFAHNSLQCAKDRSLFSIELEEQSTTDELRQAFNPAPYHFLLALELAPELGNVLDLSQDLGGVSHYLAARAKHVDSLKIDIGRAQLAALRCDALDNVQHISEDLASLTLPKSHYELIVIGHLNELELTQAKCVDFLHALSLALTPNGVIVFVSDNKSRLNKCLSPGPHRIPYRDLYLDDHPVNLDFSELKVLLNASQLPHANFFASFSTGHKISNLFAQDYLLNNPHALNHFNRIGAVDNADLSEYLLFKKLATQHAYFDNASHFIVMAGGDVASINALCQNDFCHFPGTSRKAQWRTVTASKRGTHQVTKTPILSEPERFERLIHTDTAPRLEQDLSNKKFHPGPLLLDQWLTAALHNKVAELSALIKEYAAWLNSIENQADFTDMAYDLLPFNIITHGENQDRQFNVIDSEWQLKTHYDADFVLFRALFWFAFENKAILKPFSSTTKLTSIGVFICHFMDNINTIDQLQPLVELEESVQRQISRTFRKKSVELALNQRFNSDDISVKPAQPNCQISWGTADLTFDESNSVYLRWEKSNQPQVLSAAFCASPEHSILRIDPIASTGLFHFSNVSLLDKAHKTVWQQQGSNAIADSSTLKNVSLIANKNQAHSFIALNSDPHFLFDLSAIERLDSVTTIHVEFALIHDENYDNALSTLTHIVNEQNSALVEQANGINEKLAEIAVLQAELTHVKSHRADIKRTLIDTQAASETHSKALSEHVAALEHALMMQPLARARRLMRRLLGRD